MGAPKTHALLMESPTVWDPGIVHLMQCDCFPKVLLELIVLVLVFFCVSAAFAAGTRSPRAAYSTSNTRG